MVISFVATLVLAAGEPSSYVHADLLRIRKEPEATADIEGVVRINTQLSVAETKGDWSRVVHTPSEVSGWVLSKFLAAQPLTVAALEAELTKAEGPARLGILERLLALEPNKKERYPPLLEAYRAANQKDRATYLERVIAGEAPMYIAACEVPHPTAVESGVPVLIGKLQKGKWTPLTLREVKKPAEDGGVSKRTIYDAPEAQPLWNLAEAMRNLQWAQAGKESAMVDLGTPFPAPSLSVLDVGDESHWSVRLSADPTDSVTVKQGCSAGEFWASAPFETVKPTEAQLRGWPSSTLKFQYDGSVHMGADYRSSTRFIRPLFGDGTIVTVRVLSGHKNITNYFATELIRIGPEGKAQRVLLQKASYGE
jgi:hypothetical protein